MTLLATALVMGASFLLACIGYARLTRDERPESRVARLADPAPMPGELAPPFPDTTTVHLRSDELTSYAAFEREIRRIQTWGERHMGGTNP
jgi:hypothetical protein